MIKLKNRAIALSLAGAVLFSTAAAADIISGDSYSGAKDAIKETAAYITSEADSFTVTLGTAIKADGNTALTYENIGKYDIENGRYETTEKSMDSVDGESEWYSYDDPEKRVYRSSYDGVYYVTEREWDPREQMMVNPFEDEMAPDVERLADAFFGNLKEFVRTGEEDGCTVYYGEVDASQIPALPNALCSFLTKYVLVNDRYTREKLSVPELTDIYADSAEGKITTDSNGLVNGAYASAALIGTDSNGEEHRIEFSLMMEITDLNETVIDEIDLDGKNTEYSSEVIDSSSSNIFDDFDKGIYTYDIVKRGETAYEKTGEVVIEITEADSEDVEGIFTVTRDGETTSFEFNAECLDGWAYVSDDGEEGFAIAKNYDYSQHVNSGLILYRNVTVDEETQGFSSEGDSLTLTRRYE